MVHCDGYYKKLEADPDFCRKAPQTVKILMKHIVVRNKLESKVAQNEILKGGFHTIAEILSEGAARPLHALKNEADLDKAIDLIIQKAEQKEMDDLSKIAVGCKEVQEIVNQIVPPQAKKPKVAKNAFDTATGILQSAFNGGKIAEADITATISKIDKLIGTLQEKKAALLDRQAAANSRGNNNTDLLGQEEQQGRAEA
jgi:hypothetical protein